MRLGPTCHIATTRSITGDSHTTVANRNIFKVTDVGRVEVILGGATPNRTLYGFAMRNNIMWLSDIHDIESSHRCTQASCNVHHAFSYSLHLLNTIAPINALPYSESGLSTSSRRSRGRRLGKESAHASMQNSNANSRHGGIMKRFCFPDAASESSFSTSDPSSFTTLRLASIRAGVTDLGKTTWPLATTNNQLAYKTFENGPTCRDTQSKPIYTTFNQQSHKKSISNSFQRTAAGEALSCFLAISEITSSLSIGLSVEPSGE